MCKLPNSLYTSRNIVKLSELRLNPRESRAAPLVYIQLRQRKDSIYILHIVMKWRSMPSDTRRPISTRMRQVYIYTGVKAGNTSLDSNIDTHTHTHTRTHTSPHAVSRVWTRKLPRETFGLSPPPCFHRTGLCHFSKIAWLLWPTQFAAAACPSQEINPVSRLKI